SCRIGVYAGADRQVQGHCILALAIAYHIVVVATLCVHLAIPIPSGTTASRSCRIGVYAGADRQVQGHCILALAIAYNIVVVATLCVHLAIPIPCERTASR